MTAKSPNPANTTAPIEEQLAQLHASSFGWALTCCGRDRETAGDLLQDVYAKVLSQRARFGGQSSFKTWLFGVIRRTAAEQRRWSWRRRRHEIEDAPVSEIPAPAGSTVDRETAESLARALALLSKRQHEVLHLVFYEGLSIAEASCVMGVSLGTARLHYERGKASLLTILTGEGVRFP